MDAYLRDQPAIEEPVDYLRDERYVRWGNAVLLVRRRRCFSHRSTASRRSHRVGAAERATIVRRRHLGTASVDPVDKASLGSRVEGRGSSRLPALGAVLYASHS